MYQRVAAQAQTATAAITIKALLSSWPTELFLSTEDPLGVLDCYAGVGAVPTADVSNFDVFYFSIVKTVVVLEKILCIIYYLLIIN